MIARKLKSQILKRISDKKVILLIGASQVGKSTLLREVLKETDKKALWINGDNISEREIWSRADEAYLKPLVANVDILCVDEAQLIPDITRAVKIMYDNGWPVKAILSGSSAFELMQQSAETLTGRKWTMHLYPLSWSEIATHFLLPKALTMLESLLITGSYPEVLMSDEKEAVLQELTTSHLYKDVLTLERIRKPQLVTKLLQALAWQCGQEVSYNELSRTLGADVKTIESYIDVLEKAFILQRLSSYSRNHRKELIRAKKIFFLDNGIRNALINRMAPLPGRNDTGVLWESFLITERWKQLQYHGYQGNRYFWRTSEGSEIDYLEEVEGRLYAYQFKWNPLTKARVPLAFSNVYPEAVFHVIHRDNFWQWLTGSPFEERNG